MFGKKNDLLNVLDSSKVKYFFKNGKSYTNMIKNKHFFKNATGSRLLGSNVELSNKGSPIFDISLFLSKEVNKSSDFNFNPNIFFNIVVANNVEIYSALTLLYLLKCNSVDNSN